MSDRFKRKAISQIIKFSILSALVGVVITSILTIVMSLSGFPTIMPVTIGVIIHLIIFLLIYILCKNLVKKVSNKLSTYNTKNILDYLKKVTVIVVIISMILDIFQFTHPCRVRQCDTG